MKRLIYFKLTAAFIACLVALDAAAYDFVKDGIYYNISGTNATVTYKDANYNSYSGTVNIPATVTNGGTTYNVVTIGLSAFQNCSNLRRVVIPNTVQYMSNYAFKNCTGLSNITIPASVYSIYNNVFEGCTALNTVICLNTTPRPWYANNFSSITYSRATLVVPKGCKEAYQSSSNCWGSFENVEEIECDFVQDAIFYDDLGNNQAAVRNVSEYIECYSGDIVITQTVSNGANSYTVTSIANGAFYYGYNLTSIELPSSINEIGLYAFYECINLTSVDIPDGVEDINYCTFGDCHSLQSVTIPASVTWIAQNAFNGCESLSNIYCWAATPPMCVDSSCFPTTAYSNATLTVPAAARNDYKEADVWKNFSNVIGKSSDFEVNGIYYIITGPNTASVTYKDTNYNSYSGNVTIPSTVTHNGTTYTVTAIGRNAFRICSDLTGVSIPSTVTMIDYSAFYNCTSLESVVIPNSVTELGEFCFMNCSALQTITIGNGVTRIPRQCFTYCSALHAITWPSTIKEIGPYAFYECTNLGSLILPDDLETLQPYALAHCTKLAGLTIPAKVSFIGQGVIGGCTGMYFIYVNSENQHYMSVDMALMDITGDTLIAYPNMYSQYYTIPHGVKVIGAAAFSDCGNLLSVTIPEGVTTIGYSAFYGCSNLQSVSLSSTITSIGAGAFMYCESLPSFYIPANIASIGSEAFTACTNMTAIQVDDNNPNYMDDYGVLYTRDGKRLIQYPCARADKHYTILNTCDSMDYESFAGVLNLKSVYVPSSIKTIPEYTFYQSNVERVVIDEGVEVIEENAFGGCYELKSIYLPSTLRQIGSLAFQVNTEIEQITFAGSTPPTVGSDAFYAVGLDAEDFTVYVPAGSESTYSNYNWHSRYFDINVSPISQIETNTSFTIDSLEYTTTDDQLSTKVSGVTSKTIVDPGIPPKVAYLGNLCTVNTLGYSSFQDCPQMVRAEVPFTVTWMDDYSFYGCTNLQELRLHEGLKQIDPFSVSHINALSTLTIPASVDSISSTFVTYSNGLAQILVEDGNTKYTSVSGVLYSKDRKWLVAFPQAHSATYSVPQGTQIISGHSFRGAAGLTEISLPTSLRVIERSAFYDNTSLTSVVVPEGVEDIQALVFYDCTSLTSAELPSTLTTLGYYAFHNTPLNALTVRATIPPTCQSYINPRTHEIYLAFDDSHFSSCTLYVPRGSKTAYQAANTWKNFLNIVEVDLPVDVIRGDVNSDGDVSIADVTTLIDYLLSGGSISTEAADVNLDGDVSIADVTSLIDYLLSGQWPATGHLDQWYLIGDNVGSNPWENTGVSSVGRGLLPLYPLGEFNSEGKGQLQYTGYFGADDAVMLIHNPGRFDDCWGYKPNGTFGHGGDEITAVAPGNDGYYTIMLNTNSDRFYFIPYTASSPVTFNSINIVGPHSDWNVYNLEYNMTPLNPGKENHNWVFRDFTTASNIEIKFAANNSWDYNWGVQQFPWGRGERNGYNIPVAAGTYDVYFNDITGDFHFIKK